ncbi:MAG TPA: serine--tRNA ligase, partial [Chthoniobacterales bacterium]|nr:serine--tRNA ligase [Chthoniobacterales bacterium]
MLDIRLIREKSDFVRERLATRGGEDAAKIDDVLKVDAERRKAETELQQLQAEHNRLSREIGALRSGGMAGLAMVAKVNEASGLLQQIANLNERAANLEEEQRGL